MNISALDNLINQLREETETSVKYDIAHKIASLSAFDLSYSYNSMDNVSFETTLSQYVNAYSEFSQFTSDMQNSFFYEIGKTAGLCEAYAEMYSARKSNQALKDELEKNLSSIRNASRNILQCLYSHSEDNDWITHSVLARECNQNPSALSNNIKRLISIGAVEAIKEGRNVLYHLSSVCEQYIQNNLSSFFPQALTKTSFTSPSYITPYMHTKYERNTFPFTRFSKLLSSQPIVNVTISPIIDDDPLEYSIFSDKAFQPENNYAHA